MRALLDQRGCYRDKEGAPPLTKNASEHAFGGRVVKLKNISMFVRDTSSDARCIRPTVEANRLWNSGMTCTELKTPWL